MRKKKMKKKTRNTSIHPIPRRSGSNKAMCFAMSGGIVKRCYKSNTLTIMNREKIGWLKNLIVLIDAINGKTICK